MVLKAQTVTFTQSRAAGTETTLDLVAPWLLKDRGDYNVATPGTPVEPGGPNVTAAQPQTTVAEPPAETLE
jgi:hypothetical protein